MIGRMDVHVTDCGSQFAFPPHPPKPKRCFVPSVAVLMIVERKGLMAMVTLVSLQGQKGRV